MLPRFNLQDLESMRVEEAIGNMPLPLPCDSCQHFWHSPGMHSDSCC